MKIIAKKRLGQNFLIDHNILDIIVKHGEINQSDNIVEVGAGTGNLTEKILKKNPNLFTVIEKDEKLSELLKKKFGKKINNLLNHCEKLTKNNTKLQINIALNYGSKNEIKNAFIKLKKNHSRITEAKISKNLYTSKMHDPDILIRTGGQRRLSNFMLWQLAYSELYFLDKLWPDFNSSDLKKIIKDYRSIKRNFGKV